MLLRCALAVDDPPIATAHPTGAPGEARLSRGLGFTDADAVVFTDRLNNGSDEGAASRRSLLAPSWHPRSAATRRGDAALELERSVEDAPSPRPMAEPPRVADLYNELPHDPAVVPGCVRYLWQPRVNTTHHVEGKGTRTTKGLGCAKLRKYRDAVELGVVAVDPGDDDDAAVAMVKAVSATPGFGGMEAVVVVEGPPGDPREDEARHREMYASLPGENHFLVYSTSVLGPARAFNRAVKLAHAAELVVLVTGATASGVSGRWIQRAKEAFDARPKLVMVGAAGVGHDGGNSEGGRLTLTEAIDANDGPIMVRRSAFLNLGLFAHPECPGRCGGNFAGELAFRAWLAGYHTGIVHVDGEVSTKTSSKPGGCGAGPADPAVVFSGEEKVEITRKVEAAKKANGMEDDGGELPGDGAYGPVEGHCRPRAAATADEACRKIDAPRAAMLMQYYKRPKNIRDIVKGLRTIPEDVEVLVNNDSGSEHAVWRAVLTEPNDFLVYCHNVHEIRGYNRLTLMSNAPITVTLQDDDVPGDKTWLATATKFFEAYPKLLFLSGYRARAGLPGGNYGLARGKITSKSKEAGNVPFMFAYKLVAGPLLYRRDVFLALGMFHLEFSCAGDPGIHFEYEFSLRTWLYGYQAGLWDCKFNHHVGDWASSGTRANKAKEARRRLVGVTNSQNVRWMYKGLAGGSASAKIFALAGNTQKAFAAGKDITGGLALDPSERR